MAATATRTIQVGVPDRPSLRRHFTDVPGAEVTWLSDVVEDRDAAWERLPQLEFVAGPPWIDVAKLRFGVTKGAPDDHMGLLRQALERMERLRVVQAFSAGPQWLHPLLPEGVTLCDAQGVHSVAVAEWTLMALLALVRDLPRFVDAQRRGEWISIPRNRYDADRELFGSRALILGYGSIGQAVEARLTGFGVDCTRVARTARDGVHGREALLELLPDAEIVTVHLPLTSETRGLLDASFFDALQPGALLVLASRGALADADRLLSALHAGRLRLAIDNTDPEPLPADHPLWNAPNVLITPHIGSRSPNAHARMARLVEAQIGRYVRGEPLANIFNGDY